MYVSIQQALCLRQLILQKEFACHNCGAGFFIIKSALWPVVSPPALEVDLTCANCGARSKIPLSLERPDVAASTTPTKAWAKAVHSPGLIPIYVSGPIVLAPLRTMIHQSAWRGNS